MEHQDEKKDELKGSFSLYVPQENATDFLYYISKLDSGDYADVIMVLNSKLESGEGYALWPYLIRGIAHWELGKLKNGMEDINKIYTAYNIAMSDGIENCEAFYLMKFVRYFPDFKTAIKDIMCEIKES